MSDERKLADFREWTLHVLDLLGADLRHQIAYLKEFRVEADELLLQLDDVLGVARGRLEDGSVNAEEFCLLERVAECVDAVNLHYESLCGDAAMKNAQEWMELRSVARRALSGLKRLWS